MGHVRLDTKWYKYKIICMQQTKFDYLKQNNVRNSKWLMFKDKQDFVRKKFCYSFFERVKNKFQNTAKSKKKDK